MLSRKPKPAYRQQLLRSVSRPEIKPKIAFPERGLQHDNQRHKTPTASTQSKCVKHPKTTPSTYFGDEGESCSVGFPVLFSDGELHDLLAHAACLRRSRLCHDVWVRSELTVEQMNIANNLRPATRYTTTKLTSSTTRMHQRSAGETAFRRFLLHTIVIYARCPQVGCTDLRLQQHCERAPLLSSSPSSCFVDINGMK